MKKLLFAIALFGISSAANAIQVFLVSANQTAGSGTISSLITDGSHVGNNFDTSAPVPALGTTSTAVWDWDGTKLTSTGLFSATGSIGSATTSATILNDNIVHLVIDVGGTGSASVGTGGSYGCLEGTFLSSVGASGCGGYRLETMGSESTTTWGPGTMTAQTIGGDDVLTGGPRMISGYDFSSFSFDGTTLIIGTGIAVGSQGGTAMTFTTGVPVPAAVWLFGSALGLLGWVRRRVAQ